MIQMKRIILIPIIIIFLLAIGGTVYFLVFKKPAEEPHQPPLGEKTPEEIMQSLTAPTSNETTEVAENILKSLTAPSSR